MPSGPKKRRAARRKRFGKNSADSAEDDLDVSAIDFPDHNENDKADSKQSVDQIALEPPLKKSEDVPAENKEKKSESEYVDKITEQAPLNEPSSKKPEENGESASEIVNEVVSVSKEPSEEPAARSLTGEISKDAHDSFRKPSGNPSLADLFRIDDTVRPNDSISRSSQEQEVTIKRVDECVPGDSIIEANVETFSEYVNNSFKEPLGGSSLEADDQRNVESSEVGGVTVNHVESVLKEDKEMFMEGVHEEPDELQAIVKIVDPDSSVPAADSVSEENVFPVEGVVQRNTGAEVDESVEIFNHGESVVAEGKEVFIEEALQDPIEKSTGRSSLELQATDNESVMVEGKEVSMEDVFQDPIEKSTGPSSLELQATDNESVMVEGREVSMEDVLQDPIEKSTGSSSPELQATYNESVMVEGREVFVEDVLQDPIEKSTEPSSPELQARGNESVMVEDKEVFIEDVLQDLIEKSTGRSLLEVQATDKLFDHLKEAEEDPSVAAESDFEDAPESFDDLGTPRSTVSPFEGGFQFSGYPNEPHAMVQMFDQSKVMALKEVQDPSITAKSVFEANVETSIKDDQGSFKKMSKEVVLKEHLEEPIGSLDEKEAMIETVDRSFIKAIPLQEDEDPSVEVGVEASIKDYQYSLKDGEEISIEGDAQDASLPRVIEVKVEASLIYAKDSFKEPLPVSSLVEGNEVGEVSESAVNHVVSVTKEGKEISMEDALQDPYDEALTMVLKIADRSFLKAIPSKEALDLSVPVELVFEAHLETPVKDSQDPFNEPHAISSLDDLPLDDGPTTTVKPVNKLVLKAINLKEDQDSELNVESSFKDEGNSSKEPLGSPNVEGVVQSNDLWNEVEDPWVQPKSIFNVNVDTSLEYAQGSVKESSGSSSLVDESPLEENEPAEVGEGGEGVVPESWEDLTGYSDEPQEMVKIVDQSTLEEAPSQEAQAPVVPVVSVIEVDVETSSKYSSDSSDSLKGTLGSISSVEGDVGLNDYQNEPMVMSVNKSVLNGMPLKDAQDVYLPPEEAIEVKVEASLIYAKDSFKEPFRSSSDECAEVGENASVIINHVVSVVKEGKEMSMEDALQDHFKDPFRSSSDEPLTMVLKIADQSFLKAMPSKEAQVLSVPVELVFEARLQTALKDSQDPFNEPHAISSLADVSLVKVNKLVLKAIHLKEDQDSESNMETSLKDYGDSSKEPLGSPNVEGNVQSHDQKNEEGEEMSKEVVLQEHLEEPIGSLDEHEAMVETVDRSFIKVIPLQEAQDPSDKVGADTSIKDDEDSLGDVYSLEGDVQLNSSQNELSERSSQEAEDLIVLTEKLLNYGQDPTKGQPESSFSVDVSSVEGIVQGNECGEVGEKGFHGQPTMVNHVHTDFKEEEENSMEGVEEALEPLKYAQDDSLPADDVTKVKVEKSLNDVEDSFKEPVRISSLVDVSLVEENEREVGESVRPIMVDHVDLLKKEDEGVVEESWEDPIGYSSDEPQEMAKIIDQSIRKEAPSEEAQGPPDSHDSLKKTLGSISLGDSSHEPEVMIMSGDLSVLKATPLKDVQDSSSSPDEVIEVKVEASLIYAKDSFKEPLPIYSLVEGNECAEVAVNHVVSVVKEGEEMSMEDALQDHFKDQATSSSDEPLSMVLKMADNSFLKAVPSKEALELSVPVELVFEAHLQTSLKASKDPVNAPQAISSLDDGPATMVKTVNKLVLKTINPKEYQDSESNVETSFKEDGDSSKDPLGSPHVEGNVQWNDRQNEVISRSLDEPHVIANTTNQCVMKQAQDPCVPAGLTFKMNVDTSLKDTQDSVNESSGSSSLVDSSSVEENETAEVGESAHHVGPIMDEEMSKEGVLEESWEDLIGYSSDEPQAMFKIVDQSILKEAPSQESQDSLKETLGSISLGDSSHEPQEMVMSVDESVLKGMPLKDGQDASLPPDEVIEVKMEASLIYAKDSFKEPLGNSSLVEGNECAEVVVNHVVSVVKEGEEMSMEDALQDHFKDQVTSSSDEPLTMVLKIADNSFLKAMPSKETRDLSVPVELVYEVHLETPLKDSQDPFNEPQEISSLDDGPATMVKTVNKMVLKAIHLKDDQDSKLNMETSFKDVGDSSKEPLGIPRVEGIVEWNDHQNEVIGLSSHEPQLIVKKNDHFVIKQAQDPCVPAQSTFKMNVDKSLKDAEDSIKESSENSSLVHVSPIEENEPDEVGESVEEMFKEGVLEESWEDPIGYSSDEPQAVAEIVNKSILKEIPSQEVQGPVVPVLSDIEVDVKTSFKNFPDSLKETLGSLSPVEGDVQLNGYQNEVMSMSVDQSNLKAIALNECSEVGEKMSTEIVLHEHMEEPIGSLDEKEAMVKTVDQSIIKAIPLQEAQYPSAEDSLGDVYPVEGNVQDASLPPDEVIEVKVEASLIYAKDSFNEPIPISSLVEGNECVEVAVNHVVSVVKEGKEMSIEDVLQDQLSSSDEPLTMVLKTADQSFLKAIPLKEALDLSVPVELVFEAHLDTSLKDSQDPSNELHAISSLGDVSLVEGIIQGDEHGEISKNSSHDPATMVKTVNKLVLKAIHLKENQDFELNVETSFKDDSDSSSREPLGSPQFEDNVRWNDHQNEVIDRSLHEPQFDQFVMKEDHYPAAPAGSILKMNVDTSLKDAQGSNKESSGSPSLVDVSLFQDAEVDESASRDVIPVMVNHAESVLKEDEQMSMKRVLENEPNDIQDSLKKPLGSSSPVDVSLSESILQENKSAKVGESAYHDHVESVLKEDEEMPMERVAEKAFQDSSIPAESVIEVNQDSYRRPQQLGSFSQVDVSLIEGVVQRNDHRNDLMVGLVRTLLEEIRYIRALYEEGLRQTTEISSQISQLLEKFDTGKLT